MLFLEKTPCKLKFKFLVRVLEISKISLLRYETISI